jgi:hypothetical protein
MSNHLMQHQLSPLKKIILKIIIYNASHSSNHPAHSAQLNHSHLSTRHRLLTDEVAPPCRRFTRLPSTESCPLPPLTRHKLHRVPSPPLCHFNLRFPFNSEVNALKIHHRRRTDPLPTPFLPVLRPIKGTERPVVPHHTPSRMSSQ